MNSNATRLSWGILGTGNIAGAFASALGRCRTGKLVAVASRQASSAQAFAARYAPARGYEGYEKLLADPAIQAVYISLPHPMHAEWCIKAARAGKHILCEKPLTLNHAEAMAVAEAARENKVFLMEAFMYRCHPLISGLVELIRAEAIGEIGVIQATFSFKTAFNAEGRLFKNSLGGGGILDVGCYAASIARLVAGVATGRPFANPVTLTGTGKLHPETGTDLYAAATALFPGGIVAQLATGVALEQDNGLRVFGSGGSIHVPNPFVMAREGGETSLVLKRDGKEPETITVRTEEHLYALEADAVGDAVAAGALESPFMPIADSLGNMAALDVWREAVGVVYESERPAFPFPTVSGEPLRRRPDAAMTYGTIEGVKIPVSRLIMGVDNQRTISHVTAMFDDFFARGGNAFDTAWLYQAGAPEKLLGRWIERRGIRAETVVLSKGAHTPFCTPDDLDSQFRESLERLGTNYADIYLMHRDNLDVPVGEFVDVLNEHHRAGRMNAFGGSNWTLERLRAANAYAEKKGLQKFTCVSNNFSLARMVSPVWSGCISASEAPFKKWVAETGTSLLAWSSQSRGFFTDRAHPDKRDDAELVRCWYSDDNFERRERAIELARKKGLEPINIALAYVLAQPFATFALVGPRLISETVSTCRGLGVTLSPEELRWLNLEA